METDIELLKYEIQTLKRENAELRETNNRLKQSLEESVRSKPKPRVPTEDSSGPKRKPPPTPTADRKPSAISELQQQLNRTIQQLSETRQQLRNVQERLTVSEQVNAVTQRRELQQEGVYENLPKDNVYEKLRFDPTKEHVYTELRTHAGCIIVLLQL